MYIENKSSRIQTMARSSEIELVHALERVRVRVCVHVRVLVSCVSRLL